MATLFFFNILPLHIDCQIFVGLNYTFQEYNIEPQILWQTILRAKKLNVEDVNLELRPHRSNKNLELLRLVILLKFKMKDNFNLMQLTLLSNKVIKVESYPTI